MKRLFIAAAVTCIAASAAAAGAQAQALPPYAPAYGFPYQVLSPYSATPPTKGALASDGQTNRYLLGGTWLYEADPNNIGLSQDWEGQSSAAGWGELTVPNSYNAGDFSQTSSSGYIGWYRRDFSLPAGAFASSVPNAARSWIVEFESVNYDATVWLNGHELGTHAGAYLPFEFTLKDLRSGTNRLVVRVDDQRTGNDFPPGPGGGWWNFGGILDAVYLLPVARAEIDSALIRPELNASLTTATIDEQPVIRNVSGQKQTVTLTGKYGSKKLSFGTDTIRAGGSWSPTASVTIQNPKLWAPGSPTLYDATLTLKDSKGKTLGGYSYESGIRKVSVVNGQLELNNRLLHLRGVNLHEQTVSSGAALSVAQQQQLINWVKDLGATIIRAHYPLDPEMEEMADKAGILLWSEVPVYQLSASALAQASVRNAAMKLVENNITTNQNHPAIVLWSIGNELPTPPTTPEAMYISAATAAAKALDPTRPVGMAVSNWPGVACQTAYAPLDVIGINEYFSWFDAGGGTNDDAQALGPYLESVRQCYPNQALMITEFGYGGNRTGSAEVRGTYAYQQYMIGYTLGVFNSLSWLSGAMYFPMQDFAVEPGYDGSDPLGDPPYVDKGVLDQYGNPETGVPDDAELLRPNGPDRPTAVVPGCDRSTGAPGCSLTGVSTTNDLRRTPLYDAHRAAGAKLVPFAGWEMPIQYGGIKEEHLAVRTAAGVFDVSHMGQVETRGPQALDALQRLVSNDVRKISEGGSQYSVLCNPEGGVLDDLFTYRLGECEYLTVTNASNHETDLAWMQEHASGFDADVLDKASEFAMLAVQGPTARAIVSTLADGELPPRFHVAIRTVAGVPALVCGTGYTGEDGVELLVAPERATAIWDALLGAGVAPCGLGARDTLRLEACFHLYGNDLDTEHDPISAGLGWCCVEDTGFIGSEKVAEVRNNPALPAQKLVPFMIDGPGIARQGNTIVGGGVVTSGSFSPSLERGIGMAYVSADAAVPGQRLQIDVRGSIREAVVERKPLYRKD